MSDMPPEVRVEDARQSWLSGASVVWFIPIIALIVAMGVAWQSYKDRGPIIIVEFKDGAGIAAGETELKYRDIPVGKVEKLGFSEGLERVQAHIRVEKDVAPYIDSGSVFWIVEPKVTAQGITGLSTVLSGVYIEGSWDDKIGEYEDHFQGASTTPLIRPGRSGLQIALRSTPNGYLTDDAPILYRGIEVGKIGKAQIAPGGSYTIVEALIFEEHADLVNSSTRFWDTSGFDVTIGPKGAEIDFASLASLIGGGVTFDTFVSGGEPVQDGKVFQIYADKETARNSLFTASEVPPLRLSAIFDENVAGLTIGAAVELNGLRIGEVESLVGVVDEARFGDRRVRLNVTLAIQPARLGLTKEVTADAAFAFMQEQVANGVRARLATASLLTGGLKVELLKVDDALPARLEPSETALPILPITQSVVTDTAATVEGVFNRINELPVEELMQSAIDFLNSAEALVSSEDIRETPGDVRALLADLSGLVNSDDVQNIPVALNATLVRIEGLVAQLEERRAVDKLTNLLDELTNVAGTVNTSVEGLPALMDDISAVAKKAKSLELQQLVDELTELVRSADAIVSADEATALPGALKGALDELNATLQELREGGAVRNVNEALASARDAANSVAVSARDFPAVVDRLNDLMLRANRTIEGYNQGDKITRETTATLREIQQAAKALTKLARTIERNPNSLLLGR